ncbi:DNA ligase 1-like [Helianthus annuus]|uniref:DNA ligase 1-like n=1 Tax=Helianthus annuus TaxID=4232 RepID=UPI000B8EEED9|nr:DNA ligase 1-like [Helianthus annuus]
MKETLDDFIKRNEEAKAAKAAAQEPEGVAHTDSSDADGESSDIESEIDKSKIGVGKITLKKKPRKKKKGSDEEVETYIPTPQAEKKKGVLKRKANPQGVIPRRARVRKGSASVPEIQSGAPEVEVEKVDKPEVEKKGDDEDGVVITGERVSTPPLSPENPTIHIPDDPKQSPPKKDTTPGLFEGFPNIHGEFKDNILPDEDYDMFHDATIKDLTKKVSLLEKGKAKAEADRDELKKKLAKAEKINEEMKSVVNDHAERIDALTEDLADNAKLIDQLTNELSKVNARYENMNETNQTLHQMLDDLHEASSNENKVLKLEIEALRADKAVKDEQLNMLYVVVEHKLGIDVQDVYNDLEIQRVEQRRIAREKELAKEATQRKKELIVGTQEVGGSSSQPKGDVEMVDAGVNAEEEHMDVDQDPRFVLVADSVSLPYSFHDIIRLVQVEQHKRKVREPEMKLLRYKEEEKEEEEEEKLDDQELKDIFDDIDNYVPENDDDDDD